MERGERRCGEEIDRGDFERKRRGIREMRWREEMERRLKEEMERGDGEGR